MKLSKYEIDVAHDYPLIEVAMSLAKDGLKIVSYAECGPGGGNQNFVIVGRHQDWNAWCMQNYSEDPESHKIGELDG